MKRGEDMLNGEQKRALEALESRVADYRRFL